MPTPITPSYGTAAALTMTWASLASSTVDVGIQSDALDIAALACTDLWIGGKVTLGTTPTVNTRVEVWGFPSYDGTSYAGGPFGATAAAVTPPSTTFPAGFKTQGKLLASFAVLAATTGTIFRWGLPLSDLWRSLPSKLVLFGTHSTVAALNSTGTNHEVRYLPLNYQQ